MKFEAGFIGCGNMGGALASAAAKSVGGKRIAAADHHPEHTERLNREYDIQTASAQTIAAESRFLFLGVKPQGLERAAEEIRETLSARRDSFTVVTMAAGIPAGTVSGLLDGCPVIRIMPNTPVAVGAGIVLYSPGEGVSATEENAFVRLMEPAGMVSRIDENRIDAASVMIGCAPAFVYLFAEALIDGGIRCGLPRNQALEFVLRMFQGSAALALQSGTDPALLRAAVCSPAGSTIEGVAALESGGVRAAVLEAVTAAYRRTLELAPKT